MKTYKYVKYGEDQKIELVKAKYSTGNLAISMNSWANGYPEPWSSLTVNLPENNLEKDCAFVDINGNGDDIVDFLIDNNIAIPTGKVAFSGYCMYPEFKFTEEILN